MEMHILGMGFMDNPGFAGSSVAFDGACAREDTRLVPKVCLKYLKILAKRKMIKEVFLAGSCRRHGH